MAIRQFIKRLKNSRENRWDVFHHAVLRPRDSVTVPIESAVSEPLAKLLLKASRKNRKNPKANNFKSLYTHQAEALKAIRSGKHVVVSTPMASGKSLIYYLAFAEEFIRDSDSRALFVFPIKALSRDQLNAVKTFFSAICPDFDVAVYDGDTPSGERVKIRSSCPSVIITNPDMLHYALLPYHAKWQKLWENLRLVVLDEIHVYRGVFGSHVAQILRRLRRVWNFYNNTVTQGEGLKFILLSATIGNPLELATQLTGLPQDSMELIDNSSAPLPLRHFLFLRSDYPPSLTASWILAEALSNNLKTIVFTRSRRMTELIFLTIRRRFPDLAKYVSSYRAGLLPSDRREIERKLSRGGNLKGIISTSAMELGVDIGDLDVCVLVGYPGTIMSTWQRAGRVGRSGQESAIILIPQADALDHYVVTHPEHILSGKAELAVVDAKNPHILSTHLVCSAAEHPIEPHELSKHPHWVENLRFLKATGRVFQDKRGIWFSSSIYPHRLVDIRQTGDGFTILSKASETERPFPIGSIDGIRAFRECHPGAIYLHLGETYEVTDFELLHRRITVRPFYGDYFTNAIITKETKILEILRSRQVRNFILRLGRLKITEQVIGYEKKSAKTLEVIARDSLELPPQHYETVGFWIEIEPWVQNLVRKRELHFMGGIHALEHALISMFPLLILCDRTDIGGIAYPLHPEVRKSAIFIYDGYEGGIGICEKAFDIIELLFEKVIHLLESCDCSEGCPGCIHSPRCGSGNKPLDKEAAKEIARALFEYSGNEGKAENNEECIIPIEISVREVRAGEAEDLSIKPELETNIVFLDVETQFLAEEVGGWGNAHLMRVSVAVVYDESVGSFLTYREHEIEKLLEKLTQCDLVIGFNILDFDYKVLSPYARFNLSQSIPTLDLLKDIRQNIGRRISLDHLAAVNIGENKIADGIQAVKWFREGNWKKLVDYCCHDVMITRKLFYKGLKEGGLYYCDKYGKIKYISLNWSSELLERGNR